MDYALAKKLKDAGFPGITKIGTELNLQRYRRMDDLSVSFPFLQELIYEIDGKLFLWRGILYKGNGQKDIVWFADIELSNSVEEKKD